MSNRTPSIEQAPTSAKRDATVAPVLSLLLAATLWGLFWYPLRVLEARGLAGLWLSLTIYAAALLAAVPMLWGRAAELRLAPGLLLLLALASGWCNTAFILAMLDGNVVRVLLLFYLSPVWASLLAVVILREPLHASAAGMLVVAMAGAVVMLWRPGVAWPWLARGADWLALTSGMAFALTNVMVRKAQAVSVRVKTVVAWSGVVVVAGALVLASGQPLGTPAPSAWWGALLVGAVGMVVMTMSVQYGVTHMPVHRSAVILLFEILVGAVSARLLSNETIHGREWIGGALIVAAAYLAARSQARRPDVPD